MLAEKKKSKIDSASSLHDMVSVNLEAKKKRYRTFSSALVHESFAGAGDSEDQVEDFGGFGRSCV